MSFSNSVVFFTLDSLHMGTDSQGLLTVISFERISSLVGGVGDSFCWVVCPVVGTDICGLLPSSLTPGRPPPGQHLFLLCRCHEVGQDPLAPSGIS